MSRSPLIVRTPVALLAMAGCVALTALGCGDSKDSAEPMSKPAAAPAVEKVMPAKPAPQAAAAPTPTPAAAPAAASGPRDPKKGEAHYVQYCSSCHGLRGAGDGPVGLALVPKPAKHSDGGYMNALSNEHLFKVIKEGGAATGKSPLMAPWGGVLSDEQVWEAVAFVRSLAEPAYTGEMP